ncbi:VIT1/CCC1 family protein [Telmatospirillum sp.]|uniref:VIT1/CCC1 family protein n=1 Tax=Telmatospirillum sp. TaxID=2079197 RepID=UPI00283B2DCA|nr:VIT1/CCC1 family protein [Telmatospirillum sp.]MDR3436707.1 VIT1/CCC1 family protein [Telmatospirillum sp.]
MADSTEKRFRANLQTEIDGAHVYRVLAEVEADPHIARIYRQLAMVEEAHAVVWQKHLEALGRPVGAPKVGWRSRVLGHLARRFGPGFVLPVINGQEQADSGHYDHQPEAVADGLPQAERSHARVLQAIVGSSGSGMSGVALSQMEGRHRSGGNALRAAVLGANDGLVSNLSLVAGVAGASVDTHMLLITGLAGLVAGACSMAMGEWLSVSSSRELYQKQIDTERAELEQSPEEEKEELTLIYQAKGFPEDQARTLSDRLMSNKDTALDSLVREELGIDPKDLGGSAWVAAGTSFCLFALGALFPITGFFFLDGNSAIIAGIAASSVALFGIGVGTSLFTGRGTVFSGLRQLAIGLGAAAVTYGIGQLVGVSLGAG